jgi:predicted ATPase
MLCPLLVGREQSLQSLLYLFEQVQSSKGQVVLISGEAGIGKSRLVRELRKQLQPALVLQSGCYELDQAQPYAPVIALLGTLLEPSPATRPKALPAALLAEMSRLLHRLSDTSAIPNEVNKLSSEWCNRKPLEQLQIPRTVQAAVQQRTDLCTKQPIKATKDS